jgi:hypothetical protein
MRNKSLNIILIRHCSSAKGVIKKVSKPAINFQPFNNQYGPIGRSANSGITATVFGAYGFLGRYLMNELGIVNCSYTNKVSFTHNISFTSKVRLVQEFMYHSEDVN